MADVLVEEPEYHGSLVAFEGPRDIISTQLRLLPTSPKLLVLPPVQSFFSKENTGSLFDVRSHILETHEACDARTEIARTFLRGSRPDNKRLVFLNGGTASAHMSCITAISQHETNGDIAAAETMYNQLIQHGVAGLKRQVRPKKGSGSISSVDGIIETDGEDDEGLDDPISKAMRAADRLDRETAFLQDTHEIDLTITTRPRSMSVPARPVTDDLENAAPFYLFRATENNSKTPLYGAQEQERLAHVEARQSMMTARDPLSPSFGEAQAISHFTPTSTPGSPYAKFESMPGSPVLLGEARLVDIRPSMAPHHKRIRSVDRIYATAIRNQDISLCNFPPSVLAKLEEPQSTLDSTHKQEDDSLSKRPILRSNFYSNSPYPTSFKTNKTLVRKKSPPALNLEIKDVKQPASYAIQGMDPGRNGACLVTQDDPGRNMSTKRTGNTNSFLNLGDELEIDINRPFETVLPLTEDLVIHFKCEETEPKLEAMVQAFRDGTYPGSTTSLIREPKEDTQRLDKPIAIDTTRELAEQDTQDSQDTIQESTPIHQSSDDYDPFAYYMNPRSSITYSSKQDSGRQSQATVLVSTPPTPAQTPPPEIDTPPKRAFHDFDIKACKTAVCVQNSLRSILNLYFPPENMGYQQFNFPMLPELSSFWRPVFREIVSEGPKTTRKIDLILAIGAQKRVDKELLNAISGSLEKLGREPNGKSRSGRLDLRYLIASTMQAFTSQPLTSQTQDNPFSNPFLLATLIIPHLETYIAAHTSTRFLILEYPADYLSTILALQHLIGVDLLKIAGIIDAEASESKPHRIYKQQVLYASTHPTTTAARNGACATLLTPKGSKSGLAATEGMCATQPSFSKANFILTSTATESEIASLIATIWRILVDISTAYIPNNTKAPDLHSNPPHYYPSPSSSMYSDEQYTPLFRAAVMLGFAPAPEQQQQQQQQQIQQQRSARSNYVSSGTTADLPPPTQRPITPISSSQASITGSFQGTPAPRTPRTAHNQRNKLRHLLGREVPTASNDGTAAGYSDLDGEEEEDDDGPLTAEERKYMPLWSNQGVPRKGNTRKALKWLGLTG
ncbi:hypothetical protein F4861DRAFT_19389 [Xylaria intraflava]|nr:hypothetical protein F4861DRAFT_19389 [Xylaria intraflava]